MAYGLKACSCHPLKCTQLDSLSLFFFFGWGWLEVGVWLKAAKFLSTSATKTLSLISHVYLYAVSGVLSFIFTHQVDYFAHVTNGEFLFKNFNDSAWISNQAPLISMQRIVLINYCLIKKFSNGNVTMTGEIIINHSMTVSY